MDITEQIHRYECEECGTANSCATDAEGRRLCAADAAELQRRGGRFIEWDDDASQLAEMTPAVCGWCGEEVMFVDGDEAWQLKGKTAPGWDTRPFTCLAAPDNRHDPEVTTHTREAVQAAWERGYAEAEAIAGEDDALYIMWAHGIGNQLGAGETLTEDEAVSAFNVLADDAKDEYNPNGYEDGDIIRSDSCGDLVVNLASGFLRDPKAEADHIIAAAWKDLDLPDGPEAAGPERDAAIVAEVVSWF